MADKDKVTEPSWVAKASRTRKNSRRSGMRNDNRSLEEKRLDTFTDNTLALAMGMSDLRRRKREAETAEEEE